MRKFIFWLFFFLLISWWGYDFAADVVQDVIASNNGATWAPTAQKALANVSYFSHQYRVAREAYAFSLKMFTQETDQAKALFRIAASSERLNDYKSAAKFYQRFLTEFPNHALASTVKGRLADLEAVYLEFVL